MKFVKRVITVIRELAWILAFCIVFLPAIKKIGAQQSPKPDLTMVATPNDEKLNPALAWISEYRQPFIYQVWWAEIAQCEGIPFDRKQVSRIQFYQVNAPAFIPSGIPAIVYGVTYENGQTYVAYPYVWNRTLIEHEMAHSLRRLAGDPNWTDHSPRYYDNACGIPSSGEPPPNE